jgi:hypothetical protein
MNDLRAPPVPYSGNTENLMKGKSAIGVTVMRCCRFYSALLLSALLSETPPQRVAQQFGVGRSVSWDGVVVLLLL